MKSTDLRVGNLAQTAFGIVEYRGVSPDKPNLLFVKYSNGIDVREHIDDIKPIPLTEEWLVKFGFENTYSELTYKEYDFKKFGVEINSDIMTVSYNYGNDVEWVNFTHIKHVHTLQNLYHALTGEELELKP